MINVVNQKVLVFHPTIAPYRIHFFNELHRVFGAKICLYYSNLKSQTFDYSQIRKKFQFEPDYFVKHFKIWKRTIYLGHIKKILNYKPDIIIVSEYGEGLWTAVLARIIYRRKYKIITICDDSLKIAQEYKGIRKVLRNIALRMIDGIILCNEQAENWYKEKYKIKTISFPIIQEESEFRENEEQIVELAHEYIDSYKLSGKKVFLYVGRLAIEKNVEYLVQSFIGNHEKYPNSNLVLIGSVTKENEYILSRIQKMIGEIDYVLYVGKKEGIELKAWYFVGQVLILPSKYERFGAVVNEALLAGEYVMVSENAGAACLVNDENGEIIDISKPLIDFKKAERNIKPVDKTQLPAKSKMPFLFQDIMQLLIEWVQNI